MAKKDWLAFQGRIVGGIVKAINKTLELDDKSPELSFKCLRAHQLALLDVTLFAMLSELQLKGKYQDLRLEALLSNRKAMKDCCEHLMMLVTQYMSVFDSKHEYGIQLVQKEKEKEKAGKS